jgi:DNA polymerase I-like protein with 3'-5' exonuclease and polymerase domains
VLITTQEQLHELLDAYWDVPEFAFDVETIGPVRSNPRRAPVVWLSLATGSRFDVIPMGHPNGELDWEGPALRKSGKDKIAKGKLRSDLPPGDFSTREIERHFFDPPEQLTRAEVFGTLRPLFHSDQVKIGHNVKFDLHAVAKYVGGMPAGPYYDTMISSWLLDVTLRGRLGLKECVERELGIDMVKGVGKNVEDHAFSVVADYSGTDADLTYRLKKALDARFSAAGPAAQRLLALEMAVLYPVLEMEATGIRIDRERLQSIDTQLRDDILALQERIYKRAGRTFNIRSNPQKQEVLFAPKRDGGQGLRGITLTPDASKRRDDKRTVYDYSVGHKTLDHYSKSNELVADILEYGKKTKLHGTYVLPYLGGYPVRSEGEKVKFIESRLDSDRIFAQFKQNGAETGRFSAANPNLQNIPSRTQDGARMREAFVADPGHLLIVADYSQIEPRIIASLSGDETMIRTYLDGGDVYQSVADRMRVDRSVGKTLVLAIAYGTGADTISTTLTCTVAEARELIQFFNRRFPAIQRHKDRVVRQARKDRYSETVLGRRRPLPAIGYRDDELRSQAERQAYNHLIQGTAADIMKIALVNVHAALPDSARMLLTVHDEIVITAEKASVPEVRHIVKDRMEAARPGVIKVPLVADVSAAANWREGK